MTIVNVETLKIGDLTILGGEVDEFDIDNETGEVFIKFGNGIGWETFKIGDSIVLMRAAR